MDHVLPATHGGLATHESVVLFHTKAAELQAQLVWLTSELPVLYSDVVGHVRQLVSPASENWPAAQPAPQTALLEGVQAEVVTVPAHEVQVEQGAKPVAFHEAPETHERRVHVAFVAFQPKLGRQLHCD